MKKYRFAFFFFSVCACFNIYSQQAGEVRVPKFSNLVRFTENLRQWPDENKFRAQLDGGALWVQKNSLVYSFYDKETYRSIHANYGAKRVNEIKTSGFRILFKKSNPATTIESYDPTPDYCNYFIGKDQSRWAGNARNYKRLRYKNLWPGIDLELDGGANSLKNNFYVKKGADVSVIQLFYDKVESISLKKRSIVVKTALNELVEFEPYAFQLIGGKKVEVSCDFELKGTTVSYKFPSGYNKNYELVIDPVLVFACSSGSTADNFGMTATYDSLGNLYSGGTCFDQGFPIVNAFDSTYNGVVQNGMTDVVITKYDSSGTFLQYSTYVGGASSSEIVTSLIVDKQNNLYLYGATGSADFPMTAQAWDSSFNGGDYVRFEFNGTYFDNGTDIYVAKLNASGNTLLGSTFIGGQNNDGVNTNNVIAPYVATLYGQTINGEYPPDSLQYNYGDQYRGEIQLDLNDYPVICSSSRSNNFPTLNAADNSLGGYQDAVVFKFDPSLSALQWSTFVGGSSNDAGYALFIAQNNEVYFTGGTRSTDFPATTGAYKTAYSGGKADGYIGKLSANGNTLLTATYFGTSLYDQCYFIQLDKNQNAYVFGQSDGNIPVLNVAYSNTNGKLFVSKFNSNLSSLVFSTVIGNGAAKIPLSPAAFLVDCSENIYLSGWGGNIIMGPQTTNMPLTSDAIQSSTDGFNFYLMVLSKNVQQFLYGTYFGGGLSHEHVDGGTSRFDKRGIIYQSVCAGCWGNDDFPVTPGSWPTAILGNHYNASDNANGGQGGCNNGTFKMSFEIVKPQSVITTSVTGGCSPLTINFINSSVSYNNYLWNFGNGDTTSIILNPVHTYTAPGTYTTTLIAQNSVCYNGYDTSTTVINVYPVPQAAFATSQNLCGDSVTFSNSSTISSGTLSYNWDFGNTLTSASASPGTIYYGHGTFNPTLIVTSDKGCKDTASKTVTIQPPLSGSFYFSNDSCVGNEFVFHPLVSGPAGANISYYWDFGVPSVSNDISTEQNPVYSYPNSAATYSITLIATLGPGCSDTITGTDVTVGGEGPQLFVPNTFTPNNDGKNDIFRIRGPHYNNFYFAVYNRWGQLIWETNDPKAGWDGTFNGMQSDPGVFGWYLRASCSEGSPEIFKKGNVTLIR